MISVAYIHLVLHFLLEVIIITLIITVVLYTYEIAIKMKAFLYGAKRLLGGILPQLWGKRAPP